MFWIFLFILLLNVEASTNIISKSELFKPLRRFLFKKGEKYSFFKYLHELFDCPYCMSVWVSAFYVIILLLVLNNGFLNVFLFFCFIIALHRLSNVLHYIIDFLEKYSRRNVNDLFLDKVNDTNIEEEKV
jgi:hypothetical protein